MGELDNQPTNSAASDPRMMEDILRTVTHDLRVLQQDLVSQLSQDVSRLQAERSRLLNDIEKLQAQQQMLQSEQQTLLTQQQLAQQKVWAKQLAQALAGHLYTILSQRLSQSAGPYSQGGPNLPPVGSGYPDPASQAVQSLDASVNQALMSLQRDLNSYQSAISQQINRMQTMEQQGEALLDALVNRLSQRLQRELAANPPNPSLQGSGTANRLASLPPEGSTSTSGYAATNGSTGSPATGSPAPQPVPSPSSRAAATPPRVQKLVSESGQGGWMRNLSQAQVGLILILISTLALSLHNVVVRIIAAPTSIFGIFNLPNAIALNSLDDSLLILCLRMVVVVPIMGFIASSLYPAVWRDVKTFYLARDRRLQVNVVGSGAFLFLSQVLIYIAIAQIGPGVAVTILFMYPLITVPLAWFLFGDRPTRLRWTVMFIILSGVILTALPRLIASNSISPLGVFMAILSGFFFALYLLSMQISFRKLHPVPVSLIQFVTILILTSIMLVFFFPVKEPPINLLGLILGGVVLGTLTLIGYLLNNLGVQRMGAARASIIASSGPVLTALLAFLIAQDKLQSVQWMGIVLVTLGIFGLSFERMQLQNKAPKPSR